jgi:hypothetical protein
MCHRDAEYNYQDAALASLFVACKVEDTIKKSKEILCAAHNIKYPDHPLAQDDKVTSLCSAPLATRGKQPLTTPLRRASAVPQSLSWASSA